MVREIEARTDIRPDILCDMELNNFFLLQFLNLKKKLIIKIMILNSTEYL